MKAITKYCILIVSFMIYAATGIFTKYASMYPFLSWQYILLLSGAVCVLGVYAVLWQQIIRRIPVSDAYMFKGTSIVWAMIFSCCLFGEGITLNNLIGASIIIAGITLYAYVDRKEVIV